MFAMFAPSGVLILVQYGNIVYKTAQVRGPERKIKAVPAVFYANSKYQK